MTENHRIMVRYITRRQFLTRLGGVAAGAIASSALAGCARGPEPAAPTQPPATDAPPAEVPAEEIGGELDYFGWEGYDMLSATEAWRQENSVRLNSSYISTSEDTPAKVLSPGGSGIDLINYSSFHYDAWIPLDIMTEFTLEEVPNIERMYPFFQTAELWRKPNGNYFGVPLTWLNYVCNYRADLVEPPTNWADLILPEWEGRVVIVDDPAALFGTACAILDIPLTTMTSDQLDEVGDFLAAMKSNAITIAPSYGDMNNLLIAGEAHANFVGWGALDVWAQEAGTDVRSVLPQDAALTVVDAYAIPPTTDNRSTALAWLNLMLTDEVQLAVVNELMTATVCPQTASLIEDESIRAMYDYENFESMVANNPPAVLPPLEAEGDSVGLEDILRLWEEIKAS